MPAETLWMLIAAIVITTFIAIGLMVIVSYFTGRRAVRDELNQFSSDIYQSVQEREQAKPKVPDAPQRVLQ